MANETSCFSLYRTIDNRGIRWRGEFGGEKGALDKIYTGKIRDSAGKGPRWGRAKAMRVVVVGAGPSGSNAAYFLAQAGIETYLLEQRLQGEKPCGGGILPVLLTEYHHPEEILERKVYQIRLIAPSARQVSVDLRQGFIGTISRFCLDAYLRQRAQKAGAHR